MIRRSFTGRLIYIKKSYETIIFIILNNLFVINTAKGIPKINITHKRTTPCAAVVIAI